MSINNRGHFGWGGGSVHFIYDESAHVNKQSRTLYEILGGVGSSSRHDISRKIPGHTYWYNFINKVSFVNTHHPTHTRFNASVGTCTVQKCIK